MSWDWSVGFVRFQTPLRILVTAGALVATLPLALSAADAQPRPKKKPPVTLSTAAPGTLGFTPSVADPKLAAKLSRGTGDRQSVVSGKSVSIRVDRGCRGNLKKKKNRK